METLIGILLLTFALYMFSSQIDLYNKIKLDMYRYQYFSQRDRLTIMVANGELEESSWEYEKIVKTINFHISTIEKISIFRVLRPIVEYHTSEQGKSNVKMLKRRIDNPCVRGVLVDFFRTTKNLLWFNSRTQIWVLDLVFSKIKTKAEKEIARRANASTANRSREKIDDVMHVPKATDNNYFQKLKVLVAKESQLNKPRLAFHSLEADIDSFGGIPA